MKKLLNSLNAFYIRIGLKPHPSNYAHFTAGVVCALLVFIWTFFKSFRYSDYRLLLACSCAFVSALLLGLAKETLDKLQGKEWDWLDVIYTAKGGIAVAVLFALITELVKEITTFINLF